VIRVVLDPGVILAALISPRGTPADILRRWAAGEFQLVASEHLLVEFAGVARREKFRRWFSVSEAEAVEQVIRAACELAPDVSTATCPPPDQEDAHLVRLVVSSRALAVITGDRALLGHRADRSAAMTPAQFVALLDEVSSTIG